MGTPRGFERLSDLLEWLRRAPSGTRLEASEMVEILERVAEVDPPTTEPTEDASEPATWREKLWKSPPETRLGVVEVAEALGRPKSFVYARTGSKAEDLIPHRKLDGALVFTAGELRAWIEDREEVVHAVRRRGIHAL